MPAAAREPRPKAGLRSLVIGCGSIGKRHVGNLVALHAGEVFAFDLRSERRNEVASTFGVKILGCLEEAWEYHPDIALITVPTSVHVPVALEAAQHRCHLFIEKPLSDRLNGIDQLYEAAEEHKLITMVGCNMRFHPGPVTVKKLIDGGLIGKGIAARIQTGSYLPDWRPDQDYRESPSASGDQGGGAILDCIHELDLALWYFGPGEVVAAAILPADSIGLEVEGLAEILIRHESGALSSVHLNFVQRDYRRCCQIIGTGGSLYWDFEDGRVRCYLPGGERRVFSQPPGWERNRMFVDELTYFLRCVRDRTPTFNGLENGLAALRLALKAKEYAQRANEKDFA